MESAKRPVGLTVFAVINFVFAAIGLLSLSLLFLPAVQAVQIPVLYKLVSPIATTVILLLSGIGFLKLRWGLGYVLGNVFGIASLLNIIIGSQFSDLPFAIHIPSMIYPTVLLILLNSKYRPYFKRESAQTNIPDHSG